MWSDAARCALLVVTLLGLLGCDGGAAPAATSSSAEADQMPAASVKPKNEKLEASDKVQLYRDGSAVKVGDTWEQAKQTFVEPRGAFDLHDLPPKLPSKDYEAKGWETSHGEGFGVILYGGKVAVAMYQLEHTKEDTVQEILKWQWNSATGKPDTVVQPKQRYWYWNDKDQTLMVCAFDPGNKQGLRVTVAMGDDNILKAIGISHSTTPRTNQL